MARVTITEAATRLHVSPDSIRRRLRKGELRGERDNRGQWWLDLADDIQAEMSGPSVEARIAGAMLAPGLREPMQPMQPDPALLENLARERQRADQAEARADRAETHLDQVMQDLDQVRQEREQARIEAAAAQGAAGALREALAEARRPAWRRWLGLP